MHPTEPKQTAAPSPDAPGPGTPSAGWHPAHDGGRPEGRRCAHAPEVTVPPPPHPDECEDCPPGDPGRVRLRRCTTCGHVGCCDSSRGRHAYAHYASAGHPVAVSLAPDESWAWCYEDETFLVAGAS